MNPSLFRRPAYLPTIDGLRGIAIALVFFNHSTQLFGEVEESVWPRLFWRSTPGGFIGVDLFFVVSGFLITSILLGSRDKPRGFRTFWLRRALRIFPLAYLYLGALVLLAGVLPGYESMRSPELIAAVGLYYTNFHIALAGWILPAASILWSLSVEEQFYTLWPILALRLRIQSLWRVVIAVLLLTPLARLAVSLSAGTTASYVLLFCRWDTLAAGALLALLYNSEHWEKTRAWCERLVWPALCVVLLVLAVPFGPAHARSPLAFEVVGYSALAGAFFVFTALALSPQTWLKRVLTLRPLVYMGKLCYGLYVWHVVSADAVIVFARELGLGQSFYTHVALWLPLTLLIATLSYRLYEAPLLRLKDRLSPDEHRLSALHPAPQAQPPG
jgi:peptidoglycan/LPS O-acetylase OafA/YrhL